MRRWPNPASRCTAARIAPSPSMSNHAQSVASPVRPNRMKGTPLPRSSEIRISRVLVRGRMKAVDLPLVEKARHRRDLVGLVLGGGDGQGPAFLARATADPVEKIGEERLVRVGAPGIEHQSQRPRAARANGLRLRHWPVTHPLRRPPHAQARRLGDIRVIVERSADGALGQPKRCGQIVDRDPHAARSGIAAVRH